jgi:hypothetical protein
MGQTNSAGQVTSLVSGDGNVFPAVQVIAQQHTQAIAPLDTAENTLFSFSVPANLIGVNGTIRISCLGSCTNSANNKTLRAYFGGSNIATQVLTTVAVFKMQAQFSNRNSLAAQILAGAASGLSVGPNGTSTVAVTTLTIDTSAAQTLTVTGQKAAGAESLTLESVVVELLRGA